LNHPNRSTQLPLFDAGTERGWRVRVSLRTRRMAARVGHDGSVEIVVPRGVGAAQIAGFVRRHQRWIERQQSRAVPVQPFPPHYIDLPALGERWLCLRQPEQSEPLRVVALTQAGMSGSLLLGAAGERLLQAALRRWLTEHARQAWLGPLLALAGTMQCEVRQLQLRWQRTRWGSCSTRGTISLNGALLFQSPAVVRYLWVHELAHLRHMNHGARFWAHVARFEPDWRALDRELRVGWRSVPHWLLSTG